MMATIKKRGDKYTAMFWVPDPSKPKGKAQRRVTGRTKSEVAKKERKIRSEVDEGRYITPAKVTIAEYFPKALEIHSKSSGIREQSHYRNQVVFKRISACIGSWTLSECDSVRLEDWLRDYQAAGNVRNGKPLSGGYMKCVAKVLKIGFKVAVRQKLIRENPMREVAIPSGYRKEVRIFSPEELSKLEQAWEGDRLAPFYELVRDTGMRKGEAKALRWSDLDLKTNTISISKTIYEADGRQWENEPKSKNGFRKVALDGDLPRALKSLKAVQAQDRLRAGEYWKEGDFLFTDSLGNRLTERMIYLRWKKVIAKAGIPYNNFHALRHTHITDMLRAGILPHVLAKRVGDTVKTILTTYAHAIPEDDALVARKAAELRASRSV